MLPNAHFRRSRRTRTRTVNLLVGGLLAGMAVLTLGAVYQQVGARLDRDRLPPPGERIRVGDARMHLHCRGEGSPTVILESASLGFSSTWGWVAPEVARFTRVCAYDRAGLGWSEPRSGPRDAATIARELHELMEAAGEEGPFVLAAHSLGGIFARAFAAAYPEQVAGVVFVDSSHPDQLDRMSERHGKLFRISRGAMDLTPGVASIGVLRATNAIGRLGRDLPGEEYRAVRAFAASPRHLRASQAEMHAWEASMEAARHNGTLGDRPVSVLSAGVVRGAPTEVVTLMRVLHEELAALSTRSRLRRIEGADHYSILMSREHAPTVAEEIRWTVEAARAAASPDAGGAREGLPESPAD